MLEGINTQKGYIEGGYRFFYLYDQSEMFFDYHYHKFHKCLIVLEGHVLYTVEGRDYELSSNDIIWVPSYEAHKVHVLHNIPYKRVVIYLSTDFMKLLSPKINLLIEAMGKKLPNTIRFNQEQTKQLLELLPKKELTQYLNLGTTQLIDQEIPNFIQFLKFMNIYFSMQNTMNLDSIKKQEPMIIDVLYYIQMHLHEELTIDQISGSVFMSRYYFMRKFKKAMGVSVHQYILTERLGKARELMKLGHSLTDIAYQVGYKDYTTFARSFKKTYRKSPREFMKLNPTNDFE